ncbi:MAG: sensor histidine kinase N-terminal domain-containing protein [Hyphomicrobium zavarzinii]|jgi:two-component system sensor histidine kinase QseC|uniref:ATP-binding protein n=1 Tax=Hyphomicrobium zavarzinii TaxID=48292 RepID=UPI001A41813C|nr:ATP-binding protein [Hyphomicrobium zavarzinii]MBL8846615.1 sensor histidine kinase N-terminal domain-containing protein [Hyphomicrobium zavarzinii]HML44394.1 sensor histidine kinase N-terminal domain-containing protein [Hyphomicrobium zavarzinii]
MNSLNARLFALLLIATSLVWALGMAWIYSGSRKELERVLDARLEEATRMVSSLIDNADVRVTTEVSGLRLPNQQSTAHPAISDFQLACQVWSIDGRLVGKSSAAPMTQLTHVSSGYSNQEINGARWRVFAREDRERGIRVLVGDSVSHRERLVRELMWGLAGPGVVVLIVLSGLIWAAIRQGLAPLRRLTQAVSRRNADALDPIDIGDTPREISPVVDALNGLFEKVVIAREHERSVTAFAAHELRTPLAGLRTQVQVALAAQDPAVRETALKNALVSADRTTRMARQLLALAQIDAAGTQSPQEWIDAGTRIRAVCDDLRTKENPSPASIDDRLFGCRIRVNPDAFHAAVRNLTENAIQYSRGPEPVRWSLAQAAGVVLLTIEDDGPGIPADEIGMVTKRFFRGRHKSALGSGLGLSIADTALQKDGLALRLQNRAPAPGLRAEIVIDVSRVTLHQEEKRNFEQIAGAAIEPV